METVRRVAAWPFLALIKLYQLFISPVLPQTCRFYPSCSSYAAEAIRRFGPLRGSWMAARRLARCHPWNPGGVDHVPPRGPDGRPIRHNDEAQPPTENAA